MDTSGSGTGANVRVRGLGALWGRLTLRRRARRAFAQARGSLHVPMLREAQERLEGELRSVSDALAAVEQARVRVQAARDEEMVAALSRHLVVTHLAEVSGIGMKDHADILREVFDSNLEDLRSAHWVLGLPEGRQRSINEWILAYRRQFPRLLQEDFPGRPEVLARYRRPLAELAAQIAELREARDGLLSLRDAIGSTLGRLWPVTVNDYVKAMRDPSDASAADAVASYERGAFALWESMPDWFSRACQRPEGR